ncbi:EAL domain-containing protein [Fodinisporobacter ferrooxydans]|uniref:EAL domain-containing protein n=1 Tax=Fodinisporobacter ferrooxydans TaxID=2901836 RepID=A0ABY4CEW0_9BACL|nr:EAL domain-containing protein [Alicyclobacillaceae bacterium MYW30-H2]
MIGEKVNIDTIIHSNTFHHFFQPLYHLSNWSLYGNEALFRTNSGENPETVFFTALKRKKLYELDMASISKAISFYSKFNPNNFLFVNVFPSTLENPFFMRFIYNIINKYGGSNKNIVFEIVESQEIKDIKSLSTIISFLQQNGFRVALDDIGKGSMSFQKLIELSPDFIKLDRYFSMDLSISNKKQKLIQLFVNYCESNVELILEGIEKETDLAVAKCLGVSIGQGYLLGMPNKMPVS